MLDSSPRLIIIINRKQYHPNSCKCVRTPWHRRWIYSRKQTHALKEHPLSCTSLVAQNYENTRRSQEPSQYVFQFWVGYAQLSAVSFLSTWDARSELLCSLDIALLFIGLSALRQNVGLKVQSDFLYWEITNREPNNDIS